jgi:hypothetical protein
VRARTLVDLVGSLKFINFMGGELHSGANRGGGKGKFGSDGNRHWN